MTPAEHTLQRERVKRSLLETHCDVYAPRARSGGRPDDAIRSRAAATHRFAGSTRLSVRADSNR